MKYYDVIVIGAGSAGLVASKMARGLGKTVALIEKKKIGGTCTLTGCIPSKTLIAVGKKLHQARQLQPYGISIDTSQLNSQAIMDHVRSLIQEIYATATPEILEKEGITVILGTAQFTGPQSIRVEDQSFSFNKCILASGSVPLIPPIEGLPKERRTPSHAGMPLSL